MRMTFGAEFKGSARSAADWTYLVRFSKPLTVTLASAALLTLPLSGAAFADGNKPQPAATVKVPQPTHSAPAKAEPTRPVPAKTEDRHGQDTGRKDDKAISLKVAVDPTRVRAGASYDVTITVRGATTGTATVTSPEGKSYRVALSGGGATKTLTAPAKTKTGDKTVSVKVGNKVATASFEVVSARKQRTSR
jgi:hypothetical protein